MSRIEIVPAIDIIDGKCVRLSQGDYGRVKTYGASPLEMAERFASIGVSRLHVVDLDGAKASNPLNLSVLEKISSVPGLCIEWGGGIKSESALRDVFNAGASFAVVGSVAARKPELFENWLIKFGGEKMVLGADVAEGRIAVNGWLETEQTGVDELVERFIAAGLKQCIVTDISRDGMLRGPATDMYEELQEKYPGVDFTVSGGISSANDIVALDKAGLRKVIVGKAIYENLIPLNFIEKWLRNE
ncbi:MAG: 1-(5-phosphoribosyl)-5-[(5-phosphoribosylamino)methylideneamino]imidazole-4-carboxamide isomerase [Bacteroides sp.]|nr:1-(5-phosphoribosyl)-5-[(5-phosphoribosylamino)methylideneamino]imidazole-4-carboxamide isomerase [Bacteroides sp.]